MRGNFNVNCVLSNLTIEAGERVGVVILQNPPYSENTSLLSFTEALYSPAFPVLYGQYNQAGGMSNIAYNNTARFLESKLDLNIKDILDCVAFKQGEVYRENSPYIVFLDSDEEAVKNFKAVEALEEDGEEDESFSRYLHLYGFEALGQDLYFFDGWELLEDRRLRAVNQMGTATSTFILRPPYDNTGDRHKGVKGQRCGSMYELLEFFSYETSLYPGFPKKSYPHIKLLDSLRPMYFLEEVFQKLASSNAEKNAGRESLNLLAQAELLLEAHHVNVNNGKEPDNQWFNRNVNHYNSELVFEFTQFPFKEETFWLHYQNDEGCKDFTDVLMLDALMTSLNKIYLPSRIVATSIFDNTLNNSLADITREILSNRSQEKQ